MKKGVSRLFMFVDGKPFTSWELHVGVDDEPEVRTREDLRFKHVVAFDYNEGVLESVLTCDQQSLEAAWRLGYPLNEPYTLPLRELNPDIDPLFPPSKLPLATGAISVCGNCDALYFDKDGSGQSMCKSCQHHAGGGGCVILGKVSFFPA